MIRADVLAVTLKINFVDYQLINMEETLLYYPIYFLRLSHKLMQVEAGIGLLA